ncbi:endothelial cell adhesion molecule a [Syngnathus scovelli]|uniref:endothelial cell adhesion molecule a n=1 Tax=Syngnathus scovelli TaxID=161590 RepID=UPI00210F6158|nr:endothelial cell adhesion molecule a [Syngnathus scovelli]
MEATLWKLTVVSFTCLLGLSGIWAEILMAQTQMDVLQGHMVVLKASYNTVPGDNDLSTNTILWNFVSDSTHLIIAYTKDSISVGSVAFKGRVGFTSSMPSRDVSLFINNTRESDSGRYICQVIIPDKPGLTAELSLDVKVPPAVPKCTLSGEPVQKGNVTLSCKSNSGKPIPLYKWKRTSPTSEVFFSPMLNEKTGILKLSNLSSNMSGKYACNASNEVGYEVCFINLEISNPNKVGVIVGATVGTVVGILCLLLIFVFFLKKKKQRDNEDDLANEIKEDAQAPKRVSWAKSGMGSDIISKNGTLSSIASSPQHREQHNNHHHHQQHLQQYPQRPPSDTASVVTATGSVAGYRPSRHQGVSTPTHYGYNSDATLPRDSSEANGGSQARPERYTQLPQAQMLPQTFSHPPQFQAQATPPPPPLPSSTLTGSNISRMGGVPIMVPAQNQAGSLV